MKYKSQVLYGVVRWLLARESGSHNQLLYQSTSIQKTKTLI